MAERVKAADDLTPDEKRGLGERVRALRGHRSQAEIAKAVGVDVKTIGRLESGQFAPSVKTLIGLAKALKCPLDLIVFDPNEALMAVAKPQGHGVEFVVASAYKDWNRAIDQQIANPHPEAFVDPSSMVVRLRMNDRLESLPEQVARQDREIDALQGAVQGLAAELADVLERPELLAIVRRSRGNVPRPS